MSAYSGDKGTKNAKRWCNAVQRRAACEQQPKRKLCIFMVYTATSPNVFFIVDSNNMVLAFNKPYGVLSQFTTDGSANRTLAEFGFPPDVYPLGRLDADSEGLLLVSDEKQLNAQLLHPRNGHKRTYWAQVERIPTNEALDQLQRGVVVRGEQTRPCTAWILEPQPCLPERTPPVRFRKNVPTCWLALELTEGKNRQVRKMTAAVGFPTLRLFRASIGNFQLGAIPVGTWRALTPRERLLLFAQ